MSTSNEYIQIEPLIVPPKPALPIVFSIAVNAPSFFLLDAQANNFDVTPDSTFFCPHL